MSRTIKLTVKHSRMKDMAKGTRRAFLAAFREVGNMRVAAELAGVNRHSHYEWLKDPEYARQFEEAKVEAIESLEAEARRRAVEGWVEPVYQVGEKVGSIRKYSDVLLIFLLKGAKPEVYRDRYDITARTVTATLNVSTLTDAELRAQVLAAAEQLRGLPAPAPEVTDAVVLPPVEEEDVPGDETP